MSRVELNPDIILDKNFKTTMRGYNQEEVDAFLDIIIEDYKIFESEIRRLTEENERLKRSASNTNTRTVTATQSNYDVLKRLSNLEKAVFGPKISERE